MTRVMCRRQLLIATVVCAVAVLLLGALNALASDSRYTGQPPVRNADGSIHRSAAAVAAFRKDHPCPSTGQTTGACPKWAIDHVVPLDCGGVDDERNMQWLPLTIKACAGTQCKDRWERKVYCPGTPGLPLSS